MPEFDSLFVQAFQTNELRLVLVLSGILAIAMVGIVWLNGRNQAIVLQNNRANIDQNGLMLKSLIDLSASVQTMAGAMGRQASAVEHTDATIDKGFTVTNKKIDEHDSHVTVMFNDGLQKTEGMINASRDAILHEIKKVLPVLETVQGTISALERDLPNAVRALEKDVNTQLSAVKAVVTETEATIIAMLAEGKVNDENATEIIRAIDADGADRRADDGTGNGAKPA